MNAGYEQQRDGLMASQIEHFWIGAFCTSLCGIQAAAHNTSSQEDAAAKSADRAVIEYRKRFDTNWKP